MRGLLILLAIVVGVHTMVLWRAPERRLFGDENGYLQRAREDAAAGRLSLLPGSLRFDWRPELASRVYASVAGPGVETKEVMRSVVLLNLGLLAALLAMVHLHARWLGLGPAGSLVSAAALGLFPWFGFYVHALWPEVLHAFLLAAALLFVQRFFLRGGRAWLLPAGIALGYALLAKGSINLFVPLLVVGVALVAWRANRGPGRMARGLAAGAAVGALLLGFLLVVIPQLRANAALGHGHVLSSNRWINVELGLLRPLRSEEPAAGAKIYERYYADVSRGLDAEAQARSRVLENLRGRSPIQVLGGQLSKLTYMVLHSGSFLERVERKDRWRKASRPWLEAANRVGRGMWYALLVGGLAGAISVFARGELRRNPGWWILAALLAYFAAALLVAPVKIRFAMPLVPVLCLFFGALVDGLMARFGRGDSTEDHSSSSPSVST